METKEFLTIEQFGERMQISRSTAYNWVTTGKLQSGTHLIHIGNIIRVVWSDELLLHLLLVSEAVEEKAGKPGLKRTGKGGRNRLALDINIFENI